MQTLGQRQLQIVERLGQPTHLGFAQKQRTPRSPLLCDVPTLGPKKAERGAPPLKFRYPGHQPPEKAQSRRGLAHFALRTQGE